jgi:hypothetical protein
MCRRGLLIASVEVKQPVHDRYLHQADQHRKPRASYNHKYQRLQRL